MSRCDICDEGRLGVSMLLCQQCTGAMLSAAEDLRQRLTEIEALVEKRGERAVGTGGFALGAGDERAWWRRSLRDILERREPPSDSETEPT